MSVIFNDGSRIFTLDPKSNMTATINSGSVYQLLPGSISLTGSTLNAKGTVSWAWSAKTSTGASASSFITGSGQSITFTPSLPDQKFHIILTASDSVGQRAYANVAVSVSGALPIIPPADVSETLPLGTTSASFTFSGSTGGWDGISYSLTSYGTGSITTPLTLRSGTLSYLGDGATSKVKLTYSDTLGQSATSSYICGVGTDPAFDEAATWNLVQEVDFTTLSPTTWTTAGTRAFGDVSIKTTTSNSPTFSTTIGSSGMVTFFTGSASNTAYVTHEFEFDGGITNYAPGENILVDVVWSTDEVINADTACNIGITDGTGNLSNGDAFGSRVYADTASSHTLSGRRYQSSTAYVTDITSSNFNGTSFATQILMVGQRIALISNDTGTDYLGGPKLGLSIPMRGRWTCCPSGLGLSPANSLASAFSTIRFMSVLSSAVTGAKRGRMTIKKVKMSRLTRPPAT